MPAPTVATYSIDVRIAAHQAFADLLAAGAPASTLELRTAADAAVATFTLADPPATVNGTTGQVTFAFIGTTATCSADATIAYGAFRDGNGATKLSLPAIEGDAAVPGYVVLSQLTVITDGEVTILSAVAG